MNLSGIRGRGPWAWSLLPVRHWTIHILLLWGFALSVPKRRKHPHRYAQRRRGGRDQWFDEEWKRAIIAMTINHLWGCASVVAGKRRAAMKKSSGKKLWGCWYGRHAEMRALASVLPHQTKADAPTKRAGKCDTMAQGMY